MNKYKKDLDTLFIKIIKAVEALVKPKYITKNSWRP